jgi:hypothetical protein
MARVDVGYLAGIVDVRSEMLHRRRRGTERAIRAVLDGRLADVVIGTGRVGGRRIVWSVAGGMG